MLQYFCQGWHHEMLPKIPGVGLSVKLQATTVPCSAHFSNFSDGFTWVATSRVSCFNAIELYENKNYARRVSNDYVSRLKNNFKPWKTWQNRQNKNKTYVMKRERESDGRGGTRQSWRSLRGRFPHRHFPWAGPFAMTKTKFYLDIV